MEKDETVITRMRWKAIHFNKNDIIGNNEEGKTEWYGVKSLFSSRQMKESIKKHQV